ncbi:MAG: hypothetical protein L0Y71_17925, partial [Gemmataceae bacterium]|nr:hypothetical protein [Gemmataceae bacterium]
RRELRQVLWKCLEKLPPRAAEIFICNEGGDTTAGNLSKAFSLSTTNIGVILHRARVALRRCLEVNWFLKKVKPGRAP